MEGSNRVTVLGVPVDTVDMSSALGYVDNFIQNDKKGNYILAVNPEKVIAIQEEPLLKQMFENASLLIADGIGIVFAIKWLYGFKIARVPGVNLMQNICKEA